MDKNERDMFFGREFGQGFGQGPREGFGRERFGRGHLNMIILELIKEQPRHGYDIIKGIEEKFFGFYAPSAGSVYPILQSLEDQGFVTSSQESGKKVYAITAEGEQELKDTADKFTHMREHLEQRFGGMGRVQGMMGEVKQTMQFIFMKLRQKKNMTPETTKKLRLTLAHFRNEVEEIFVD